MCHQASFHLKFARKYPLLALKLPKSRVVFKTGSCKKKGKKFSKPEAVKKKVKKRRSGIIPDTNRTTQMLTV